VASRQGTSLPSYQMTPSRSAMDMVVTFLNKWKVWILPDSGRCEAVALWHDAAIRGD